ncbi:MAG TPA: XrtA/PEP-CTERM system histidine kinase PrsK [Sphingomicrobium sp.]|nr:XrtA/PEP-CTERM system histidine kinase PrsK [Sphingomicrobium sp.]
MDALMGFWSHALAAACFAALIIWRLSEAARQPGQRLLASAFALTACWAWLAAVAPNAPVLGLAESARNLLWVSLLYSVSTANDDVRQHGLKMVYGAVAGVIGLQLIGAVLELFSPSPAIAETELVLRITTAAGALVLVHNLYGQASPASRGNIRFAMIGLALIWTYDLNLYTSLYLGSAGAKGLIVWRGVAVALAAPLFALASRKEGAWRVRLSRAATFQSLSLLAICAYFALMAILATALRGSRVDWSSSLVVAALAIMTVAAMVLIPSARARAWLKVKIAKHLFEHRYDYRTEWLRFTETLGRAGPDAPPLADRIVKAFADIIDAPGGMLLVSDGGQGLAIASTSEWPGGRPTPSSFEEAGQFWTALEASGRVLEFAALRGGWAAAEDRAIGVPPWLLQEESAWGGIPLLHEQRLVGLVILAAPDYRRQLDWEDFDLFRTAGHQAASSLAEALGQEALSQAQRFEEFNRRFAFILHDIKNLVSQLSLVARNAERHADNPEFRADMVATLKSSVGKMNDLLARLAPRSQSRVERIEAQPLRPILLAAIAAKRRERDVTLLGDTALEVLVDGSALEQAVAHLVQNALDASSDEPVTIRVESSDVRVTIAISDKGTGMDGDFIRNRLFQPFSSTKPGGFGIGAFEARSLVTAMGGSISVDSRLGRGTTFTIHLPAAAPAGESIRKQA